MSEEQSSESNSPQSPKQRSGARRRGRRGGRGRRRPNQGQNPSAAAPAQTENEQSSAPETQPVEPQKFLEAETPAPQVEKFEPIKNGSPLSRAADEAAEIIESLRQTLEQMEEVLELIELAEKQKISDEREIESLRRQLRRIQQPRPKNEERPPEPSGQ